MAEGIWGKQCPRCGHINDRDAMVCSKGCPGGLSRIPAKYHQQEQIQQIDMMERGLMYGSKAEVQDLRDTPSSSPDMETHSQTLGGPKETIRLTSLPPKLYSQSSPDFIVEIKDGYVVGREGDIDITSLPRSEYISRKHATFIHRGGNWFLRAESLTNSTRINFERLDPGKEQALKDNDLIVLADTTFIFKLS
jgi:pSer/pThr/pTyr-binding forkhead associated (FHA) protein